VHTRDYITGFERFLLDKFRWSHFNGHWFALFGVLNLAAYGLHLFINNKQDYVYHFGYTASPRRLFKPIKAMVGSDNLLNVAWTAPTLIGLNFYLSRKFGGLIMTKFFALSFFTSYAFYSIFSPQTGLNYRPLAGLEKVIGKFDSLPADGSYYMGADQLAQSLIYFTLLYHRLWYVAAPLMLFDLLYYGPYTAGGPLSAIVATLVLV
jgi:hypothetical protein